MESNVSQVAPSYRNGKSIASLILGILSFLGVLIPIIGVILGVIGLVLGIVSRKVSKRGLAIAGIVLCCVGLVLSIAIWILSAYLIATGKVNNPFIKK